MEIEKLSLEELRVQYSKLEESYNSITSELNNYKESYNNALKEQDSLKTDIQNLKNTNYDLFEKLNRKYIDESNNFKGIESKQEEPKETTVSLGDIAKKLI